MTNYSFQSYLVFLRKEKGLTQEQVALALSVSRANYSHYENGRITPSFDTLCKLSRIYDVPLTKLIRLYDVDGISKDTPTLHKAVPVGKDKSSPEKKLLLYFEQLPEKEKRYLLSLARTMAEMNLT